MSTECAIERKTIFDLAGTLTSRDLFDQLFSCKSAYHRTILLLEGYLPVLCKVRNIKPQVIWGVLYSLAKNGISIISTLNQRETISFLVVSALQESRGGGVPAIHHGKKNETLADMQLYFVTSLPRIGAAKAGTILGIYGNPLNAIQNAERWHEISGVSDSMAETILNVLNEPYKAKEKGECVAGAE